MATLSASLSTGLSTGAKKPRVVIAGGGVVGCTTAYYLAKEHGVGATIVDRKSIAAAASGRAGGFLAKDWNDGTPTEEMTHRSFDLHAILGEELKPYGATDYRRLTCAAVAAVEGSLVAKPSNKKLENVEWADAGGVVGMRPMGDESTIAQVHPRKLCDALVAGAKALAGASVVEGCAAGLRENADGVVDGLLLADGSCLDADAVVVCMGPWSHALGRPKTEKMGLIGDEGYSGWGLAGLPPVVGTKYHAVLLQAPRVLSQAVFFQGYGDPEVYPRPDGETYVTGSPDAADIVRDLPGETPVREEVCTKLINSMNALSTELKDAPVNHKQACHLPSAIDGIPVVGEIKPGAYAGFGHGCWGILLGPATGEALANLICTDSSPTLDLRRFDPKRFAGKFAA
mmetsp:Transcript_5760/g.18194  ORF Transcript_5760/g.18194 Transcript_5760/m.18194 type:complete len:400 (-) Transcript_5760:26-1225(-)